MVLVLVRATNLPPPMVMAPVMVMGRATVMAPMMVMEPEDAAVTRQSKNYTDLGKSFPLQ
jgi:hypothetical protein